MGTAKRNLYVTNTNDKSKCIILSAYIPIKKEDGKYYMPDNTPLGYDMWIPNVLDLKEEEETVEVEVIKSDMETGLWLCCYNDFFGGEQHLFTDKPRLKEGKTDKFDLNEDHYDGDVDFYNSLHIDTDIDMKVGECISVTLKRNMKVIENNFKEENSWKVACPKCNSILEYTKKDVIIHESRFFYLHYIKCPCCGDDVDVVQW